MKQLIVALSLMIVSHFAYSQDEEFLIQENQAGIFKVGEDIPRVDARGLFYRMEEKFDVVSTPDGDIEVPYVLFSIDGENLVKLALELDHSIGAYTDEIKEITVLSPKYKTAKGIGVGSSIENFIEQYADYKLWYTYISDMYVIDTKTLKSTQFLLNGEDYVEEVDFDNDYTPLLESKFKEGAKIQTIRFF
ncbi:hypothetical protein [Flammeovirga sp. SJP92]|uniref:hypothetical protein n=1 Tax=Flammeovirga sp. SJP92 TaxID=1775430 RepID=UPI0007927234|nr:hypothetical protein [Flammeovirga sp. SJP92]KXX69804.1 hypothetical protein AVL50_13015 [Flammeovirga sp. SJP92]